MSERRPPNRIVSLRKQVREFIKEYEPETIDDLLAALDLTALEYLESKNTTTPNAGRGS